MWVGVGSCQRHVGSGLCSSICASRRLQHTRPRKASYTGLRAALPTLQHPPALAPAMPVARQAAAAAGRGATSLLTTTFGPPYSPAPGQAVPPGSLTCAVPALPLAANPLTSLGPPAPASAPPSAAAAAPNDVATASACGAPPPSWVSPGSGMMCTSPSLPLTTTSCSLFTTTRCCGCCCWPWLLPAFPPLPPLPPKRPPKAPDSAPSTPPGSPCLLWPCEDVDGWLLGAEEADPPQGAAACPLLVLLVLAPLPLPCCLPQGRPSEGRAGAEGGLLGDAAADLAAGNEEVEGEAAGAGAGAVLRLIDLEESREVGIRPRILGAGGGPAGRAVLPVLLAPALAVLPPPRAGMR